MGSRFVTKDALYISLSETSHREEEEKLEQFIESEKKLDVIPYKLSLRPKMSDHCKESYGSLSKSSDARCV